MGGKKAGLLLIVIILVTSATGVTAQEIGAPGVGSTTVDLTAAAATFSVTVPTNLTINVSATGVVTTANNVKIVNKVHGAVKVTNVALTPEAGWSTVAYTTDMSKEKVGTKKLGFVINDCETDDVDIQFKEGKFPKLDGANSSTSDELVITYDAVIPAQKMEVNGTKIADIVFTIGWDE